MLAIVTFVITNVIDNTYIEYRHRPFEIDDLTMDGNYNQVAVILS